SQLEAALLNMAVNARDAMGGSGSLFVGTYAVTLDSKDDLAPYSVALGSGPHPQDYVRITVTDSGTGIPEDTLAHVFEPFFTTKDVGKGSGLGLSQVYGFVRQAGGYVTVRTAANMGTTINLYLPNNSEARTGTLGAGEAGHLPGGSETILLVEDNER